MFTALHSPAVLAMLISDLARLGEEANTRRVGDRRSRGSVKMRLYGTTIRSAFGRSDIVTGNDPTTSPSSSNRAGVVLVKVN